MNDKIFLDTAFVLALASPTDQYHKKATELSRQIKKEGVSLVIPNSEELYSTALDLYQSRLDKEWGMTDCISFVVMDEIDLDEALTTDTHFQQAGFTALMREKITD